MYEDGENGWTPFTVDSIQLLDTLSGLQLKCFLYIWSRQCSLLTQSVLISSKELSSVFKCTEKRIRIALGELCSTVNKDGSLKNPWVSRNALHKTYSVLMPNLPFNIAISKSERPGVFSVPNYIFQGQGAWMLSDSVTDISLRLMIRSYFLLNQGYQEKMHLTDFSSPLQVNGYVMPGLSVTERSLRTALSCLCTFYSKLDGLPIIKELTSRIFSVVVERKVPVVEKYVPQMEGNVPTFENNVPEEMARDVPIVEKHVPQMEINVPEVEANVPTHIYNAEACPFSVFLFSKNKTREETALMDGKLLVAFEDIGGLQREYSLDEILNGVIKLKKDEGIKHEGKMRSLLKRKARDNGCCCNKDVEDKDSGVDIHNWLSSEQDDLQKELLANQHEIFKQIMDANKPNTLALFSSDGTEYTNYGRIQSVRNGDVILTHKSVGLERFLLLWIQGSFEIKISKEPEEIVDIFHGGEPLLEPLSDDIETLSMRDTASLIKALGEDYHVRFNSIKPVFGKGGRPFVVSRFVSEDEGFECLIEGEDSPTTMPFSDLVLVASNSDYELIKAPSARLQ